MKVKEIYRKDMDFEYRNSFFQRHTDKVILKAWMKLISKDKVLIKEKMETIKKFKLKVLKVGVNKW